MALPLPVRYAVVGLGHIAQGAVLPAFAHAGRNSVLAALVSDDPVKLRVLGRTYKVIGRYSYAQYDALLKSGNVDAVFIALPNPQHRSFVERAARAGIHVLCEKPLAMTEKDCASMLRTARDTRIRLMTAYRLHFEEGTLRAIDAVRSGRIGEPRVFQSTFTMQVAAGNIRVQRAGGGPLFDIGIYCVNAARALFRSEPVEVVAFAERNGERRFREVDEMVSCILRFPKQRLAAFTCSFGASDVSAYRVVGTRGDLRLEPAYEYAEGLRLFLRKKGKTTTLSFPRRDQFAAELLYFSDCIRKKIEPEPSGKEGLADVRILRALQRSVVTGRPVRLAPFEKKERPSMAQEIRRPPVRKPRKVHAPSPHPPGS